MSDTRVHYNALDQLVQAFGDGKVDSHKGRAETFIGVFELIKARKQHWYECMAPDSREYLFQVGTLFGTSLAWFACLLLTSKMPLRLLICRISSSPKDCSS